MNAPGIAPAASQAASLHRIEPWRENSIAPMPPAKKYATIALAIATWIAIPPR